MHFSSVRTRYPRLVVAAKQCNQCSGSGGSGGDALVPCLTVMLHLQVPQPNHHCDELLVYVRPGTASVWDVLRQLGPSPKYTQQVVVAKSATLRQCSDPNVPWGLEALLDRYYDR